ncbi:MAG: potassium-transporting ATPase subunit KdpA [Desulfovibrionaceae bacterium]
MFFRDIVQFTFFIVLLAALSPVVGRSISRVLAGERTCLHGLLGPLERGIYRLSGIQATREQDWKGYAGSLLAFTAVGFALTMGVLVFQDVLPLNPQGFGALSWDLAFNTAASFVTNTNWQSYGGETTLSHFSQMVALTYQNFVSAAVGIAVCTAIIRSLARSQGQGLGNFWADVVRITLYILLPLSMVFALLLLGQGVVQSFASGVSVTTLEGENQFLALGPAASQVAIKLLGTNGGGFFNVNGAHPFENPTALSNFMQALSIFLLPSALVFMLGEMVHNRRHAWTVWGVMAAVFITGVGLVYWAEYTGTPLLTHIAGGPVPNLEGKELRFGLFGTALFSTVTTDASCGAVNAMHASFTPLGTLVLLVNMLLGEVIFGGVGSGLYGMLLFILLTVFIAGLMVGRTPDYLGKRIEGREITWGMVVLIMSALPILCLSAWAAVSDWGQAATLNAGARGFTEIFYAYTSATQNNGSALAGFSANTPIINVTLGLAMLVGRFGIMLSLLVMAGSLVSRKARPVSEFSFPVSGLTFGLLLLTVVLIIGALTYLPALSLGPVVEHLQMLKGQLF